MVNKVNRVTAMALMEIMSVDEIIKLSGISRAQLYKMKAGQQAMAYLPSDLDVEFIESLGLKICQCCGVRLVPTKPIRYQKLTCLCETCWSGDYAIEDHSVLLQSEMHFENTGAINNGPDISFPDEEWKDIKGWPLYQVSNYGRVYSYYQNKLLKLNVTTYRYLMVILHNDSGDERGFLVHRLVLEAFVGPCPEGKECNHKNGVKSDNTLKNLEWVTHGDNMNHAHATGLFDKQRKYELMLEGKEYAPR